MFANFRKILLLGVSFWGCLSAEELEVEELLQEALSSKSLVEERQIEIPGYKSAYNPSILPYEDGYLLSFRYVSRCPQKFFGNFRPDVSFIGVVQLHRDFRVKKDTVQILKVVSHSAEVSLSAEDARLVSFGKRIFLFFNDYPPLHQHGGNAMYFAELVEDKMGGFFLEKGKLLDYAFANPIEKNWSPFVQEGRLYAIYGDSPRVILEIDEETGYCREVSRRFEETSWWDFGEVRGGSPAYLVEGQFLTFFHSSFRYAQKRIYTMGAYTFSAEAPFPILAVTTQPLGSLADYLESNSGKRVVFPGGMVVQGPYIHVAWGRGDQEVWITSFDKEALLSSLQNL